MVQAQSFRRHRRVEEEQRAEQLARSEVLHEDDAAGRLQRAAVIASLVEGSSIRANVRMTGVAKNTVTKLLMDIGTACSTFMDQDMRDLPCGRLECDEIWAFCYAKAKNVPADKRGEFGYGDVWTWVAVDASTKLVPSYHIGPRDLREATAFMTDLSGWLANRVQLTTDGLNVYLLAVEDAFQGDVDFAQLVKVYGNESGRSPERRYSPAVCLGSKAEVVTGAPDRTKISTSYVERQNLTMRMSMRRFTRLTNAFSKKVGNLAAAVSLHFAHYNYCRPHSSLVPKVTPAMAAGLTDHVWTLRELIGLLERAETTPTRRGSYSKTREVKQQAEISD
jgi:IS1 family transposase